VRRPELLAHGDWGAEGHLALRAARGVAGPRRRLGVTFRTCPRFGGVGLRVVRLVAGPTRPIRRLWGGEKSNFLIRGAPE